MITPSILEALCVLAIFPVISLIGAIFLRAAVKRVEKLDVKYGRAYVAVLLASLAHFVLGFAVVGFFALHPDKLHGFGRNPYVPPLILTMHVLGFFIQASIIKSRLNLRRGFVVTLAYFGMSIAFMIVAGFIMAFVALWLGMQLNR